MACQPVSQRGILEEAGTIILSALMSPCKRLFPAILTIAPHLFSHLSFVNVHWTVRNIPKFRDSCDVMKLFLRKMADKTRVYCFEALRHISKTFHEACTICFWVLRIGSHIGSASWNIQLILWLISPFKQRDAGEILVSFQGGWTSIYYFLDSQIFDDVLDIFLWSGIGIKITGSLFLPSRYEKATPNFCWAYCTLLGVL